MGRYEIGVDIGGTFTDVVAFREDGALRLTKVPSSRSNPSAAITEVLARVLPEWGIEPESVVRFAHGTTVATNAVLERKGARIGLLTTEGFTDVLEIGRQNRHQIYELVLRPETPAFLAPGVRRRGVVEEMSPTGDVVVPLDLVSLQRSVDALLAEGVEAIAIIFLFSFANPAHERAAADYIGQHHPKIMVSLSSEVDPAFREYERSCVTAFDAYVKPPLARYLTRMESELAEAGVSAPLQIMQSAGGICRAEIAASRPVRLFLSGPAAGVIGARAVGAEVGRDDLITLDIGGTSSDIALITAGQPIIRADGMLDTYRIRVPMVDVNSIGAGGGSIAWIDRGGGLRVGPQSAGAGPGPACYGRGGDEATVTDASVVLGYLDPDFFAGGRLALDADLAARTIEQKIARPLGLSLQQAALGIHRVINAQMAEGIRLVSVRRGTDPRSFALLPFGGAGPVHATALASELGIGTVIVPRYPGVLSASGLLAAKVEHEVSAAYFSPLDTLDPAQLATLCDELAAECVRLMAGEAVDASLMETRFYADICYVGQAYTIQVPFTLAEPAMLATQLYDDFRRLHEQLHGHQTRVPARIVNIHVLQLAPAGSVSGIPIADAVAVVQKGMRRVLMGGGADYLDASIYTRDGLTTGMEVEGPAVIEQNDTTTVLEPGWVAHVGNAQNLILTPKA